VVAGIGRRQRGTFFYRRCVEPERAGPRAFVEVPAGYYDLPEEEQDAAALAIADALIAKLRHTE